MGREPCILGIDIGTTLVKSVAFDVHGKVLALARRPSGFDIPKPGWAECDMQVVWTKVCMSLQELTVALADRYEIMSIGVAGHMGGAWLLDERQKPLRPAILWNDGRAVSYLQHWQRDGTIYALFQRSHNTPAPGFTLPVLRWLRDHQPEVLARASHLLFCKDWVRFCLTGELATEESDASHLPGDVHTRSFSIDALALCGVQDCARLLPMVLDSGQVAGYVSENAARETGLCRGLPVVTGLADVSATLLGAGALEPGCTTAIAGTSLLNCVTMAQPCLNPVGVGVSFLLPLKRFVRALPNQTGMLALEWFNRELMPRDADGRLSDMTELEMLAMSASPGARGVMFHPYLNSTGVLAPCYEPRARGRFWGLGIQHTRADLLRAVYEGIALAMADCFAGLPVSQEPIRLVGGAANSPFLRRLFADTTGRPMVTLQCREAGAMGVAMLAGVATGVWSDLHAAIADCCRLEEATEPHPEDHAYYQQRLKLYQYLRSQLTEECDVAESVNI